MLSHTPSGIRNLHLFHRNQYVVIVEGEDHKPFWSKIFPKEVRGNRLKLISVGSCEEVKKYLEEIITNNAYFIVAIDSDYRLLMEKLNSHTRVLETGYHSIENLMLCPATIASVIREHSCNVEYENSEVEAWLCHFDEKVRLLMTADYVVELNNLGLQCRGDNCCRFLVKQHIPEFDAVKIELFIQKLGIAEEDIQDTINKLERYVPRFHARGHFFFSAVLCFVNNEVKKIRCNKKPIPYESFRTITLNLFIDCCSDNPEMQRLRRQTEAAAQELVELLSA